MPLLNYTSSVPVDRTIGQMHKLLAAHGANMIATTYVDGAAAGLSFRIDGAHGQRSFTLPVDVAATHQVLREEAAAKQMRGGYATRAQAERTAWRVVKDWLEAQFALIETGMATTEQIFLPYLMVDERTTLYQRYVEHDLAETAAIGAAQ